MKKNLAILAGKILALGCNPKSERKEEMRKVQSGIFLSQVLFEEENTEPGFHYQWSSGPTSLELSAAWSELRSQIEIFGLGEIQPPHRQKRCLRVCRPIHIGPEKKLAKQGLWARGLSATAYLENERWTEKEMIEQIRGTYGSELGSYFFEIKIALQNLRNCE